MKYLESKNWTVSSDFGNRFPKIRKIMPLRLLKNIKLRKSCYPLSLKKKQSDYIQFAEKYVVGTYVFGREELKAKQFLFNDGFPTLILMPDKSDIVTLKKKSGHLKTLKSAWVCCGIIKETYWEIPEDLKYIVVLRFSPPVFYSLFNVDPAVFQSDPIRNLEDIVSPEWMNTFEEMYQIEGVADQMAFLNEKFSSHEVVEELPDSLQRAIDHIEEKRGNITVSELLSMLGTDINRKWLQRNFIKHLGIPPKKYISLQRFIDAYDQYDQDQPEDLLSVALSSGYYDYNHFLKEFKQFIGMAPSQYAWG